MHIQTMPCEPTMAVTNTDVVGGGEEAARVINASPAVDGRTGTVGQDDGGAEDDDDAVVIEEDADGMPRLFALRFYMSCCICDLKHDFIELVGTFLRPRHELEADWTRQVSAQRAAEMVRLLFVGLDSTEPPEQQDAGEVLAGDNTAVANAAQQEAPVMSAAGFVDHRHMRMMIQTFFHPDLVDVDDEEKDTPGDRNFAGNFMAATGFVNRLWDVRRIIAVCRDVDLDVSVRKTTAMQMFRQLEKLLDDRAKAVAEGTFNLIH
ncbi:hypothetical protein ABZP36_023427 [Zizania latifolia]